MATNFFTKVFFKRTKNGKVVDAFEFVSNKLNNLIKGSIYEFSSVSFEISSRCGCLRIHLGRKQFSQRVDDFSSAKMIHSLEE